MKKYFLALLTAFAIPAMASNFSYTNLGIDVGKTTLDDSVFFFGEKYDDFAVATIYGGYQFNDNVALQISSSGMSNSGPDTEISSSAATFAMLFPIAVSEWLDVVPAVGLLSYTIELCLNNICAKDDESAMAYGLGLRAWAVPEQFELSAGWADSTLDDGLASTGLGAAFWFAKKHSIRLDLSRTSEDRTTTIGYLYSWAR